MRVSLGATWWELALDNVELSSLELNSSLPRRPRTAMWYPQPEPEPEPEPLQAAPSLGDIREMAARRSQH